MAAAPDLGSGAARRGGSSPFIRTFKNPLFLVGFFISLGREEKFMLSPSKQVPSSTQK